MILEFKRIGEHNLDLPARQTDYSAGFDLCATQYAALFPNEVILVKTGFAVQIPVGFCGMVCSRSGLALKHGVFVLNAPGIIDADYRGEIGVILSRINVDGLGDPFIIKAGDRIAQLLVVPAQIAGMYSVEVDGLDATERGEGGFGHTGVAS